MNEKDIFAVRPLNEERTEFTIVVGNHLATKTTFASEKEAWDYIKRPKWDTTFALIAEMVEIGLEKKLIKEEMTKKLNEEEETK